MNFQPGYWWRGKAIIEPAPDNHLRELGDEEYRRMWYPDCFVPNVEAEVMKPPTGMVVHCEDATPYRFKPYLKQAVEAMIHISKMIYPKGADLQQCIAHRRLSEHWRNQAVETAVADFVKEYGPVVEHFGMWSIMQGATYTRNSWTIYRESDDAFGNWQGKGASGNDWLEYARATGFRAAPLDFYLWSAHMIRAVNGYTEAEMLSLSANLSPEEWLDDYNKQKTREKKAAEYFNGILRGFIDCRLSSLRMVHDSERGGVAVYGELLDFLTLGAVYGMYGDIRPSEEPCPCGKEIKNSGFRKYCSLECKRKYGDNDKALRWKQKQPKDEYREKERQRAAARREKEAKQ